MDSKDKLLLLEKMEYFNILSYFQMKYPERVDNFDLQED
jgi:hypothetical protein